MKMDSYTLGFIGGGVVAASVTAAVFTKRYLDKRREEEKRRNYPADTVILHQIGRGVYAPSLSPFPLKLETYLRMAKIPYQNEHSYQMSSKGKTPWMTYNGEDVADSEICIEYLNEKLGIDLNQHLSEKEKAQGRAFQIMLEDHLYWTALLQRWVYNEDNWAFMKLAAKNVSSTLLNMYGKQFEKQAYNQGMGRHSKAYVQSWCVQDYRDLSAFLGDNPFILGDEPCVYDCAIFGMLAIVLWQMPGTVHERTMYECKNLHAYCLRMKERYWPDWDQCNTAGGTKEATA